MVIMTDRHILTGKGKSDSIADQTIPSHNGAFLPGKRGVCAMTEITKRDLPLEQLRENVEDLGGIWTIRGGGKERQWNGIEYKQGLSGKNVGSQGLSMNVAMVPVGGVAKAHIHDGFEVMLYILKGRVRHEYGAGLRQVLENEAGDFIYIEPGVPHEVFNIGDEPVIAIVARSAADEWDKIIPYDRNSE